MWRKFGTIGSMLVVLLLSSTVYAQGPGTEQADPYWHASYWNNMSLSGTPVLEESVEHLGFDWGYGSPHPSVSTEHFSARWTRVVDLAEATYRFSVTSDDGVRVYVDGQLIIDEWRDQAARTFSSDLALQAGRHQIAVEYYENTGVAKVALSWSALADPHGAWRGEYYANAGLRGSPVLVRSDDEIHFEWGYGSPADVLPADGFSVRWTRLVHLEAGRYRFTARPDDGIRIYVDQQLLIDEWYDQAGQTHVQEIDVESGDHLIMVEYYEHAGVAAVQVTWTLEDVPSGQWRREFYANPTLSGPPNAIRSDAEIDFDWGYGKVGPGGPTDSFSMRWTRAIPLETGTYRFTATSDDGIRVYVDGRLIIDRWYDHAVETYTAELDLAGGSHEVIVEYYEHTGVARVHFSWTRVGGGPVPPLPGEIVVDDAYAGFARGGSPTAWHAATVGYSGGLTWTRNNDRARANYNWARWYPEIEPGRYEVYVYIPEQHATTTQARYWISHYDGFTLRKVDQAANRGQWISLGTYRFRSGAGSYVSLADVTYEAYLSTEIAFDAVKWVPR